MRPSRPHSLDIQKKVTWPVERITRRLEGHNWRKRGKATRNEGLQRGDLCAMVVSRIAASLLSPHLFFLFSADAFTVLLLLCSFSLIVGMGAANRLTMQRQKEKNGLRFLLPLLHFKLFPLFRFFPLFVYMLASFSPSLSQCARFS